MSASTLPSEAVPAAAPLTRMHGKAELGFVHVDGVDRLSRLYQRAPLRVLFPDVAAAEPPQAALVTTSGGLAGGDLLELAVHAGPQARALVVGSAAEKIYRSTGADTRVAVHLSADTGARLEFLPQETILFEGARLERATRIDAAAGARVLAGEMLVFGRAARGERLTTGKVRECWDVSRDGRLVWADRLHMEDQLRPVLDAPAGFAGAVAAATLVLVGDRLDEARERTRTFNDHYAGRFGAGIVGGVLVARWLDADAQRLRAQFGETWKMVRHLALDLPAALPRLWDI